MKNELLAERFFLDTSYKKADVILEHYSGIPALCEKNFAKKGRKYKSFCAPSLFRAEYRPSSRQGTCLQERSRSSRE